MHRREALINRASEAFHLAFDQAPDLIVAAPGRVNLIGEHTDYNGGFVLPCAIDYATIIAISPNENKRVEAVAGDHDDMRDSFVSTAQFSRQTDDWQNHIRGVFASFAARNIHLGGARIAIAGDVPQGAGLSSSASLNVGLAMSLAKLQGLSSLGPTDFALIAQQSENDFVGTACGIMDQFASARSAEGSAMLLDCRSLEIQLVPVPKDITIMVIHSGVSRGLVDSAYNERRAQCDEAADHYGVPQLRDLDTDHLIAEKGDLDDLSFRRARHVVTENARTLDAAGALANEDMLTLSALMRQSHASMRDDFEITVPPIDNLVEIIDDYLGESGGVRMTGGGFGGCVVALTPTERVEELSALIRRQYQPPNGEPAKIYLCTPSGGAHVIA